MRTSALTRPDPRQAELSSLMRRLTAETGDLAARADGLQALFGRLVGADGAALEEAQALDELVQRLAGLAGFLDALAADPLDDVDAAARRAASEMKLTRQGRRLAGETGGAHRAAGGDLDLF